MYRNYTRQYLIIILLFTASCFGWLDGNFNQDCTVNFEDFAVLAADWQAVDANISDPNTDINDDNSVDVLDLALFCDNWLETDPCTTPCDWQINNPPTADAQSVYAVKKIYQTVTLSGSDDGYGGLSLTYSITSLPSRGHIKEVYLGATVLDSNDLPHTLTTNQVIFGSDTIGLDSFDFKITDSQGVDSNDATVDVNVFEYQKDCLSFDGSGGYIDINDTQGILPYVNYLDFKDQTGFGMFVYTHSPFVPLAKKRGSGAGWEAAIVSGQFKLYLYDPNGNLCWSNRTENDRIDMGTWSHVGFIYDADSTTVELWSAVYVADVMGGSGRWSGYYQTFTDVPPYDYTNDANLVIASRGNGSYKWEIDNIRFYTISSLSSVNMFNSLIFSEDRETCGNGGLFMTVPVVRFMLDEGTGTSITDDKASLAGTLLDASHIDWELFNWQWTDIIYQNYYRRLIK